MNVVVKNVRLVDCTGAKPIPSASIVVENGIISWIGEETARPNKHMRQENVEGKGLTMIPGMIDCHEHFIGDGGPDNMEHLLTDSPDIFTLKAAYNCKRAIMSGVTSARDVGSRYGINIQIAQATASGALLGPRIIAAGEWLQFPGCWPDALTRRTENIDELVDAIKEQIANSAGLIKVGATGMTPDGKQYASMGAEVLKAAAITAHEAGLKITAHCIGYEGSRLAVEAGIDSIEHGTFLDDETVRLMVDKGTYLIPTLSTWDWPLRVGPHQGMPDGERIQIEKRKASSQESFRKALNAGVKICAGTDAGGSGAMHGFIAREIELMIESGMSIQEGLESATSRAAVLAGIDSIVGTIEVGKQADFVLLDGDPLSDPSALRNIWAVYQGGKRIY
jgi:imidazolonepropionase-like amidohydrolase